MSACVSFYNNKLWVGRPCGGGVWGLGFPGKHAEASGHHIKKYCRRDWLYKLEVKAWFEMEMVRWLEMVGRLVWVSMMMFDWLDGSK